MYNSYMEPYRGLTMEGATYGKYVKRTWLRKTPMDEMKLVYDSIGVIVGEIPFVRDLDDKLNGWIEDISGKRSKKNKSGESA